MPNSSRANWHHDFNVLRTRGSGMMSPSHLACCRIRMKTLRSLSVKVARSWRLMLEVVYDLGVRVELVQDTMIVMMGAGRYRMVHIVSYFILSQIHRVVTLVPPLLTVISYSYHST